MELTQDHVHCICSIRPSGSVTKELVFTILAQHCFSPCLTVRLGTCCVVRQNRKYKPKDFWNVAGQSTGKLLLC